MNGLRRRLPAARLGRELREIFVLGPAPWRWAVGVEAALALGIPLALFTLAGQQSLGLVASLGAFTALYAASRHWTDRLRMLPLVGAGFTLASLLGAMAAPYRWAVIAVLIVVAATACIVSFGISLGPPGPVMFMLVTGVSASIAANDQFSGPWTQRIQIPGLVAVGAIAASVIVGGLLFPQTRFGLTGSASASQQVVRFRPLDAISLVLTGRVVAAVAVSACVAYPLGLGHEYWVVMVAAVVLQGSVSIRLTTHRMLHRVMGTFGGLAVFGLVAQVQPGGLWLVALLACLQGLVEVVVARHYGIALLFITPLALFIGAANGGEIEGMVRDRAVDTVIGVVIAILVLVASEWLMRRWSMVTVVREWRPPPSSPPG